MMTVDVDGEEPEPWLKVEQQRQERRGEVEQEE
jgi:hypothetical protein